MSDAPETPGDELDEAWTALEEGRPEEALGILVGAAPSPGRRAAEVLARLDLGDLAGARRAFDEGSPDPEDFDLAWAEAELLLREWRLEEARERFQAIREGFREPAALERLALIDDCEGEEECADRRLAEASALDPEGFPPPPRLSSEEFHAAVERALAELPEEFRRALAETQVLVVPMPGRALGKSDPAGVPPDILGLFSGPSQLEKSHLGGADPAPTIHLFQRNLERATIDRDQLLEEIRITLHHEIGHQLGFDEEGVDDLGLA